MIDQYIFSKYYDNVCMSTIEQLLPISVDTLGGNNMPILSPKFDNTTNKEEKKRPVLVIHKP